VVVYVFRSYFASGINLKKIRTYHRPVSLRLRKTKGIKEENKKLRMKIFYKIQMLIYLNQNN